MSARWVVRLFPAAWRRRYAGEFLATLEVDPPGPRQLLDLFYCALDARLDPQVADGRDFRFMEGRPTMRTRILAGAAVGAGQVLLFGLIITVEEGITARLALFYGLSAVGLVGVHRRQARRAPALAWVGFIPIILVFIASLALVVAPAGALDLPPIAGRRFAFVVQESVWITSSLFGLVTLAIGALPRLAAAAFAVGSPLAMVGMFLGPSAAPELRVLAYAGLTLYGIGLIWLGLNGRALDGGQIDEAVTQVPVPRP